MTRPRILITGGAGFIGSHLAGHLLRSGHADSLSPQVNGPDPGRPASLDPEVEGLSELAGWLEGQIAHDRVQQAGAELSERGLSP